MVSEQVFYTLSSALTSEVRYAMIYRHSRLLAGAGRKGQSNMTRIPRNYIAELHALGKTFTSIARELNRHPSTISRWSLGIGRPPKTLYEPIRNIARRTTYQYLRKAGYPSYRAAEFRRLPHPEAAADIDWLNNIIDILYNDWNASYRAYMANPEGWIKAHPNRKIPTETSREEIRRRIEKGIKRGKSKEEIENY